MEIIDNALPEPMFNALAAHVNSNFFSWCHSSIVAYDNEECGDFGYYRHDIYNNDRVIDDELYQLLGKIGLYNLLEVKALMRVKVNAFARTSKIIKHGMHKDQEFPHKGAILSINTCDGMTTLHDGTEIQTVANRLLIFDSSKDHCSSTTTNAQRRLNLNLNYF